VRDTTTLRHASAPAARSGTQGGTLDVRLGAHVAYGSKRFFTTCPLHHVHVDQARLFLRCTFGRCRAISAAP